MDSDHHHTRLYSVSLCVLLCDSSSPMPRGWGGGFLLMLKGQTSWVPTGCNLPGQALTVDMGASWSNVPPFSPPGQTVGRNRWSHRTVHIKATASWRWTLLMALPPFPVSLPLLLLRISPPPRKILQLLGIASGLAIWEVQTDRWEQVWPLKAERISERRGEGKAGHLLLQWLGDLGARGQW